MILYVCEFFAKTNKPRCVRGSVTRGTDIGATLGYADYEPTHVTLPWAEDVFMVLEAWAEDVRRRYISLKSLSDM